MLMVVYDRSLIKLKSDEHAVSYCCRHLGGIVAFVTTIEELLALLHKLTG